MADDKLAIRLATSISYIISSLIGPKIRKNMWNYISLWT